MRRESGSGASMPTLQELPSGFRPRALTSPPTSIANEASPIAASPSAARSTPYPLAIADRSISRSGSSLRSELPPAATWSRPNPTRARAASMISGSTGRPGTPRAPNPQADTRGATVTSNAPRVARLTSSACRTTSANSSVTGKGSVDGSRLKLEISDSGSQVDIDRFTRSSRAAIVSRATSTREAAPSGTTTRADHVVPIVSPPSSAITGMPSGHRSLDTREPRTNRAAIAAIAATVRRFTPR